MTRTADKNRRYAGTIFGAEFPLTGDVNIDVVVDEAHLRAVGNFTDGDYWYRAKCIAHVSHAYEAEMHDDINGEPTGEYDLEMEPGDSLSIYVNHAEDIAGAIERATCIRHVEHVEDSTY